MEGTLVVALIFIGICCGCFKVGGLDTKNTVFKECLTKNEIVINDVRFQCDPKTVKVGGKEVPYQ